MIGPTIQLKLPKLHFPKMPPNSKARMLKAGLRERPSKSPSESGGHLGGPVVSGIALVLADREEARAIMAMFPDGNSMSAVLNTMWELPTDRLAGLLALSACFLATTATLIALVWQLINRIIDGLRRPQG